MKVEDWIEQAASQRSDEIRVEYGYDEDLQDEIEDVRDSLTGDVKERVGALIDRMERARLDENTKIYRGAFRDGVRYGFSVIAKDIKNI